jgi:hypothetical protein
MDILDLIVAEEPLECPLCRESTRLGFLHRIYSGEPISVLVPSQGAVKVTHKCKTCGAIFGVKNG